MARYEITTSASFTDSGTLGVWLFLGGPIASGLGYAMLLSQIDDSRPDFVVPGILMAAGSICFLAGCVLLLIGRSHVHNVRIVEPPHRAAGGTGDIPTESEKPSAPLFGGTEAERAKRGL